MAFGLSHGINLGLFVYNKGIYEAKFRKVLQAIQALQLVWNIDHIEFMTHLAHKKNLHTTQLCMQ